jgi:hypothetical protein
MSDSQDDANPTHLLGLPIETLSHMATFLAPIEIVNLGKVPSSLIA